MDSLGKYYFERLMKYADHLGRIKATIEIIIMHENDVKVMKKKLKDLLDKDARFDKKMYKGEK